MTKKNVIEKETLDEFLTRKYGEGIIASVDTINQKPRDILPTILSLDIALNGGIPDGKIVLLSGKPKAGKCLGTNSSFIITTNGVLSMAELKGLAKCAVSHSGKTRNINYWYNNGIDKVLKIKTDNGNILSVTQDHPLMILDGDGDTKWKKGKDLIVGDILVGRRGDRIWGDKILEQNEAYVYGLLIGDGHLNKNRIIFSNVDPICTRAFKQFANDNNCAVRTYKNKDHHLNSIDIVLPIFKMGWYIGKYKQIPCELRQMNEKTICHILRGYFDADGGIEKNKYVSATTSSRTLATQIQSILLNLGILSRVRQVKKRAKIDGGYSQYGDYYSIYIYGVKDLVKFKNLIGFKIPRKRDLLERICNRKSSPKKDTIPNLGKLLLKLKNIIISNKDNHLLGRTNMWITANRWIRGKRKVERDSLNKFLDFYSRYQHVDEYQKIKKLSEHKLFFSEITEITEDKEHTSDINVQYEHSFISNGIMSHNTTLCLELLNNAIQLDRPAFYMDIERRCSRELIDTIRGLDASKLKIVKSTDEKLLSAEEWLDILEQIIKQQKKAVIVVDSLAMLSNLSEQSETIGWNKDMNSTTPRLVASFFRRMQQIIDNNDTILIFISQVTSNRDPMSRSKWVEKGGIAVQYSASVWIKVTFTKLWPANNDNNQIDGHDINFQIVSSALGKPYLPCCLPLRYGEGIDKILDLLRVSENVGLIDKKGTWYSIPSLETDKFQGINNMINFLKDNDSIKNQLETKVREMIF